MAVLITTRSPLLSSGSRVLSAGGQRDQLRACVDGERMGDVEGLIAVYDER